MVKQHVLRLAESSPITTILHALDRLDNGPGHLVRILTYHRVDEPDAQPNLSPDLLSATPEAFAAQMSFVASEYRPVTVHRILHYLENGTDLPDKAVLVTFDDAYRDFEKHAWPILQSYEIPVVLFVPTAYPDNPRRMLWWDNLYSSVRHTSADAIALEGSKLPLTTNQERMHAFKSLREQVKSLPNDEAMNLVGDIRMQLQVESIADNHIMDWDTLKRLSDDGVTLAPHTRHHPMLNRIPLEEAQQEAIESQHDLQQKIGEVLPIFAYPSGGANEIVAERLEKSGFKLAFTTERGINNLSTANPLLLKRINVGLNTSINILHAQLIRSVAPAARLFT